MENNKKLKRKRKLYKMMVNDTDNSGVNAISLVLTPAIMKEFVALSKTPTKRVKLQEDKCIIVSPVLIPDIEIPRYDEESGEEYDIVFGKEEIAKIAENFLINGYQNEATLEHDEEVNGVSVIESWLKESENDKSADYGFGDLAIGTWFVKMRIHDEELWNKIKSGEIRGLSIEGMFSHELVENAMVKMRAQNEEIKAQNLLRAMRDIINEDIDNELDAEVLLASMKGVFRNDNRFKSGKKYELESFMDYPDSVVNNAKKAVDFADEYGWGSCLTPVGKIRASQLANKKPISVDTIKRMRAYLIRHEVDLESSSGNLLEDKKAGRCGLLAYYAWGGKSALSWATSKLKSLGVLELSNEEIYGKRINLYETEPYFTNNYTTPAMGKPTYFDLGSLEDACWDGYVAIGTKILDGREVPNCVPAEKLEALAKAIMEMGDVELETAVGIASSYAGQFGSDKKQMSEADILRKRNKDGKLMEVENGADMVNPMNNKPYKYPTQQEQTEATKRFKSFNMNNFFDKLEQYKLVGCPPATQDIKTNLANRQNAIDVANYGPLNPNLPNNEYWKAKADQFNTTPDEAKQSVCGNCSFFNVKKALLACIAEGIGGDVKDEYEIIDAGQLGYCEAFDFKCAAKRTCDAWVIGGPLTD